jgi:hypothetical protein
MVARGATSRATPPTTTQEIIGYPRLRFVARCHADGCGSLQNQTPAVNACSSSSQSTKIEIARRLHAGSMNAEPRVDVALLESRRQTLLAAWKEVKEHGRQHEARRATATNMILLLASADIGAMATIGFGSHSIPLALGLTVLGIFGLLFTAKHYERFQRSEAVASEIQARLEELDPELGWQAANERGRKRHSQSYPRMSRIRLNKVWSSLHIVVILAGVGAFIVSLTA